VYLYWLALVNAYEAIEGTKDLEQATNKSPINKALRKNRQLRYQLGWGFDQKDKAEMVKEVREFWNEFGAVLDELESEYGIA
jgi:hypothetical protein